MAIALLAVPLPRRALRGLMAFVLDLGVVDTVIT